jgi:hypothetical protein
MRRWPLFRLGKNLLALECKGLNYGQIERRGRSMKPIDLKRFVQAMARLLIAHPEGKLSPEENEARIDMYFQDLSPFSIETVESAIEDVRVSLKFFPKPCDLLESCQRIVIESREYIPVSRRIEYLGPPISGAWDAETAKRKFQEVYDEIDRRSEKPNKRDFS